MGLWVLVWRTLVLIAFFLAVYVGLEYWAPGQSGMQNVYTDLSYEETRDRYTSERDRYLRLLEESGIVSVFKLLRNEMDSDPFISAYCHEILHEVGRVGYQRFPSFSDAVQYQDDICANGYLHGLMEGLAETQGNIVVTADFLKTECGAIEEEYPRGQCFHGAGHGLMFGLSNDLPRAIALCESYAGSDVEDCASGAFMENVNEDPVAHPSDFTDPHNLFYPCTVQKDEHKPSCYLYAPLRFLNETQRDFSAVVDWCSLAEPQYRQHCFYGIGYQVARRNALNPVYSEHVCSRAKGEDAADCVFGFLVMHASINNITTAEEGSVLCAALREYQAYCQQVMPRILASMTE